MLQMAVGACYYIFGFYDQKLRFPYIQSYVYVGKNIVPPTNEDLWYFQQPDYFAEDVAIENDNLENSGVIALGVHGIEAIADLNGLIEALADFRERE